ncbi:unnamed protein product [Candidula unifasciata]|uniref:Large ribosomal subunit protein uL18 C-terminal eukaryotes domain-containing protein n=1 Tax=Candidula unifasciata TaxID=100452 RepID=A0A8S3ZFT2_9EUPU|nr:unnamed protein product [Candidula unifasciata]
MGFVKVIKNKAYFKRFHVKLKRRRDGVTDYYTRRRLIFQNKNNTPKYGIARIKGDVILCAAYSHELPCYDMKVELTNYAAAWTLLARRLLQWRMWMVLLVPSKLTWMSVWLTPQLLFGALKGSADGGIDISYSTRFPGYDAKSKNYNAEVYHDHILGKHRQFSQYIKEGITPSKVEQLYKNAHAAIRADPEAKVAAKKEVEKKNYDKHKVHFTIKSNIKQKRHTFLQKFTLAKYMLPKATHKFAKHGV